MILTCPACATRYSVDDAKFPAGGRQVRCAKCGHSWFQDGPAAQITPDEPAVAEPAAEASPASGAAAQGFPDIAAMRPQSFSQAQPEEDEGFDWRTRLAVAAGWMALIGVVLLIGYAAVRYRQQIAVVWPQSAGLYNSLGMPVSTHGLDFDKVDYHRESEDGQTVLAVTGRIVNNGSREMPVPQTVLVTLSDASNHELYHWNFVPPAQTLKPGKSVSFITRLSSPPAAARHLEVRFPKDGQ
jgi:predicted Zn finger-like uncharacterized protein